MGRGGEPGAPAGEPDEMVDAFQAAKKPGQIMNQKDLEKTLVKTSSNGQEKKRMKGKNYMKELRKLQGELCQLQAWVKHKGLRVIIVFEGVMPPAKAARLRRLRNG
jgi:polyphosphate kinase 2 (PPK2 family)